MHGIIRKGGLFATAASILCVSAPAGATMACWNETQQAAARVRDLQSRLMVATLRCRAMGYDITPAYNLFVVANRLTIQDANDVILTQFRNGFGWEADRQYDRFTTMLANTYGGEETDRWICAQTEALADEAADAKGDANRLVALADRIGAPPRLPGGRCEINFTGYTAGSEADEADEVDVVIGAAAKDTDRGLRER